MRGFYYGFRSCLPLNDKGWRPFSLKTSRLIGRQVVSGNTRLSDHQEALQPQLGQIRLQLLR